MSGTSYGACVLHVAPEAYIGGPLALVQDRRPHHRRRARPPHPPGGERRRTGRRRAAWTPPPPRFERGYGWMFSQHILQADQGCDFDFLETSFRRAGARARHLLTDHLADRCRSNFDP
jgi:dihydroxyacid dehydratase/phosphogluconate dehydratase